MGWGFGNLGGERPAGAAGIFGDGSDGDMIINADTIWTAEPEDTGMIIRNFESLTIAEGVTVAAVNRNCGMVVRVRGDCTIAGTLANNMSPRTILDSDGVDFSVYPLSMLSSTAGDGGAGGKGGTSTLATTVVGGSGGAAMLGRFYGGGWSGGGGGGGGGSAASGMMAYGGAGGSAADITTATADVFVGGTGGANSGATAERRGKVGSNGGGGGGGGGNLSSGARGGNAVGAKGTNATFNSNEVNSPGAGGGAGNYGGGVILLFVGGNLTISGQIDCSGNNGGASGDSTNSNGYLGGCGGTGGGGGGGRIYIVHRGEISNTGVLNVDGGTGGENKYAGASRAGETGAAGSIGTTTVLTFDEYKAQEVA